MQQPEIIEPRPDRSIALSVAVSDTSLTSSPQTSSGGAGLAVEPQAKQFPHLLYFLVSAACTGPRAGLFKLGITDCLPTRHACHVAASGPFDLPCSALVRAGSRREVRKLEGALLHLFGDSVVPEEVADDGSSDPNHSPIPSGWRRHPGHRASGHSEWLAVECLEEMLTFADTWLEQRGKCGAGALLQRGIDPAECAPKPNADGARLLSREERAQSRARLREGRERYQAMLDEQVTRELGRVLDFALAHEHHLLWVHLALWRKLRAEHLWALSNADGMPDLYFGGFAPAAADAKAGTGPQPLTQAAFEEGFARAQASSEAEGSLTWGEASPRAPFYLRKLFVRVGDRVPHPICERARLLRVEAGWFDAQHPLFTEFELLAARVEGRRRWEQPTLGW